MPYGTTVTSCDTALAIPGAHPSSPWNPARVARTTMHRHAGALYTALEMAIFTDRSHSRPLPRPAGINQPATQGHPKHHDHRCQRRASLPDQLDRIRERVEALGLRTHISVGESRTIIGCIGDEARLSHVPLLSIPGVDSVHPGHAAVQAGRAGFRRRPDHEDPGWRTGCSEAGHAWWPPVPARSRERT